MRVRGGAGVAPDAPPTPLLLQLEDSGLRLSRSSAFFYMLYAAKVIGRQ